MDDDRLHEFVIPDHEVVGLAHREAAALRQDLVLADGAHVWTGSTRAKVSFVLSCLLRLGLGRLWLDVVINIMSEEI